MDGNYKINNIPGDKIHDNTTNSKTDNNEADTDKTADDSSEISIKDDFLENLDPSLRNSIDGITALINAKIRNSDISIKHKASIETQIEILTNLIKSIPSKTSNISTKADSVLSNDDEQKAVPTFDQNAEMNPQYADSVLSNDDEQKAVPTFDQNAEMNPQYADSVLSNDDEQKAVPTFDQNAEMNPQYADAYNNKGLSLYYLGDNQEAIACYDKAIEINPEYDLAFYNKGIALSVTGNIPRSHRLLRQSHRDKPTICRCLQQQRLVLVLFRR